MQNTIPMQLTIHNRNEKKVIDDVEKLWYLLFKKVLSVLKIDTNFYIIHFEFFMLCFSKKNGWLISQISFYPEVLTSSLQSL